MENKGKDTYMERCNNYADALSDTIDLNNLCSIGADYINQEDSDPQKLVSLLWSILDRSDSLLEKMELLGKYFTDPKKGEGMDD